MRKILRDILILVLLVVAIRVPFLNQAIGGDEPYYLAAAEHAQIDPWHPNHTSYIFQGREVTFRGFPHPPGNAWVLAALIALFGDIKEIPFHAVYIFFSLLAVLSVYALGRRFSTHPLLAALVFLAVPVFVINGNTLETDIPFTACALAGFAAYVWDRRILAGIVLWCAGMISPQAFILTPILLFHDRKGFRAWLPAAAPVLALVAWQCFEKISTGRFPAEVTAGYLNSYNYNRLELKLRNALALFLHSWFLIFPLLVPFAIIAGFRRKQWFLLGWIAVFLGVAMVLFYAGAARYVLPIAAPLAILASTLPVRFVAPAFAIQLALAVSLATVNYQQWNANRDFVRSLPDSGGHRLWANAEWGLRFYAEERGALPIEENQFVPTGDIVLTSDLGYPSEYNHSGRTLMRIAAKDVDSTVPLRLFGLDSSAGYATAANGFLPFAIANGPIDRLHADTLIERKPIYSWLEMNAREFDDHAASGIYRLEDNRYRWTAGTASFLLKPAAGKLTAEFTIHQDSPGRRVELLLDGKSVAAMAFPGPGQYKLESPFLPLVNGSGVPVAIQIDKTFSVPNDSRKLGLILTGIGFRE